MSGDAAKTDSTHRSIRLGIDVGGTFTDVIAIDEHNGEIIMQFKIPSTPADPSQAILKGIDQVQTRILERLNEPPLKIKSLHHGTTVGTNALIQKRGARTALLTTENFRDILELRRQIRPQLYNLFQKISPPLVPRHLRIGVRERMSFDGTILTPLDRVNLHESLERLQEEAVESIAICTLHSYANPEHEQLIKAEVQCKLPGTYVTCSSEVCPEFREYERCSTTVVNAYIGPEVSRYIEKVENTIIETGIDSFRIVKSNGGLTSADNGRKFPVNFIESGPAAGVVATLHLCKQVGLTNVIAFDMGGTTAKVGVIQNGLPKVTTEFYADQMSEGQLVGGYPIKNPVIDIIEIGAGGGSIARLDQANVLKVGPESAGADPGPACYGRGGQEPTVTDAYAALGFLEAEAFNSGDTPLYPELSREVINTHIAEPLGWTVEKACYAILELATANMAEMVRLATVRRGLDPKDFVLCAYGGAGPLHACEIAKEVGISTVIIPPLPGLLSAFGTLVCDIRHDLVQTLISDLQDISPAKVKEVFADLEKRASELLQKENVPYANVSLVKFLDLRFKGQIFEFPMMIEHLPIEQTEIYELETNFRTKFNEEYGYDLPHSSVEMVNFRMVANATIMRPGDRKYEMIQSKQPINEVRFVIQPDGTYRKIPVFSRNALSAGRKLEGPVLVEDAGSTLRVEENQTLVIEPTGFIHVVLRGE